MSQTNYQQGAQEKPSAPRENCAENQALEAPLSMQEEPLGAPQPPAGYAKTQAATQGAPQPPAAYDQAQAQAQAQAFYYPAQVSAYPPQQPAYPPSTPGYPLQQVAYPAQAPDYFATAANQPLPVATTQAVPVVFGFREWLGLGLSIVLAILWFMMFSFEALFETEFILPGLGTALFVLACFVSLFLVCGKSLVLSPLKIALLVVIALLCLIQLLYANIGLQMINLLLLFGLCLLEVFLLSGRAEESWCRLRAVGEAIAYFFGSLFRHWTKPFRALGRIPLKGMTGFGGVLLGLLCGAVLLLVILPLLISADSVFREYFSDVEKWFLELQPFDTFWKTLRVLIFGPMLFSLIYAALHREGGRKRVAEIPVSSQQPKQATVTNSLLLTTLIVVNVVYALFVFVQFAYLFGNAEVSADNGGYAQYARSGFFQLVTVAAINLFLVLFSVEFARSTAKKNPAMIVAEAFMLVCTVVILVSAYWRMNLYISYYGFSLLRALTLMGMLFIAICLVAAFIKVFRKSFVFFQVFFTAGIALWIAFNFINVDARIADYNVDRYLSGQIETMDVPYLGTLSPEVLPALERLVSEAPQYETKVESLKEHYQTAAEELPWYKWNFSYAKVKGL